MLACVQSIERELQKNASRYPYEAKSWLQNADGTRQQLGNTKVYYRGKPCRLFADERGVWAVETGSPVAFPLHYELTDTPEVAVRLESEGPEVAVLIERTSFLTVHAPMLQKLKQVCLAAVQEGALLLTSMG